MKGKGTAGIVLLLAIGGMTGARGEGTVVEWFVAPDGDDANPGTRQRPLGTWKAAQERVRRRIAAGLEADVTVWFEEGTYELSETLWFGPEDSPPAGRVVSYSAIPGQTVVLSGGRALGGWKSGDGPIWTTTVPGARDRRFRNLFVNGRRAVRARTPNADAQPNCRQLVGAELAEDRSRFTISLPEGFLGNGSRVEDVEVMIAGNWAINRKRVAAIDVASATVVLAPPHRHGPAYIFPSAGRWFYLENAREFLDQPGEWYLDRESGILSYWPRPGEKMAEAHVVAPRLTQLIRVTGTADWPVRNLQFRGLRFEHTDWQLPPEGYMGIQACHYGSHPHPGRRWRHIPAALTFTYADGCGVEDAVVAHLGTSGIELADGCHRCRIQGNHIFDISANGILIGGPKSQSEVPRHNEIANNHVHACGREYYGAIGIWVGFADGAHVAHNLVHDLPYTGISVGWQWNPEPTPCKNNVIEQNHVYDVMNRLCDGGCIYTLGFQPGTIIRGNHLHDVHRSPMAQGAPNNGMFIDQGSKGYLFERNVIYTTSAQRVRFNQCSRDWHTWRDNHFGDAAEVREAGQEIVQAAGLEAPYRQRLTGGEQ